MSNLTDYAEAELRRAGMFDQEADYGGEVANAVMELMTAFAAQGHSGGSASIVISMFERLARFKPLTPLTGADDEWMDVSEYSGEPMWQNVRVSSVFKDGTGKAYDIDAVVYEEPSGARFSRSGERHWIEFPYMPTKPRIIKVPAESNE